MRKDVKFMAGDEILGTVPISINTNELKDINELIDKVNQSLEKTNSLLDELASKSHVAITLQVESE